jgi:hypothetical protein
VDLERLFRQIVLNLAATDPGRLRQSLSLSDLRDSIVPYRAHRRTLQIESSEEYELALIRLCAGERGLARAEPAEIQDEFASEISGPNPDLDILQRREAVLLHLNPDAVAEILQPRSDLRFAPVQTPVTPERPTPRKRTRAKPEPVNPPQLCCNRCGGTLPVGRVVNFCPQCGQNLTRRQCPQCNTELESTWKHCVSCGVSLGCTPSSAPRR